MATEKPKPNVISMFRPGPRLENEPEATLAKAPVAKLGSATALPRAKLDLTGKPKVWFLVGPNGSGKTVFARWMGWQMAEGGRSAIQAALDPQNRALANWFQGVIQPDGNDAAQTTRWLADLLEHLTVSHESAVLDFGGGDTALSRLITEIPDLVSVMTAAGVHPVLCCMIGPRVDDLSWLSSLHDAGFLPPATMIVLNEGKVDSTILREEAFARVLRHSAFTGAVNAGAVPLWMPRLEPEVALEIEGKQLTFGQARDGHVPEGVKFSPIGGFRRSMVGRWLGRMEQEFAPVATWRL